MPNKNRNFPLLFDDITEFKALLPKSGRLLAIDYGKKTIGIAISDLGRKIANRHSEAKDVNFSEFHQFLQNIFKKEIIVGLVIGLPLGKDGEETPMAQSCRQLGRNLYKQGVEIPIFFQDERFSTSAIIRMLETEADLSRQKRAAKKDSLSATYFLQTMLDRLNYGNRF